MATPTPAPAAPAGYSADPPDLVTLRSYLNVARILALVFWIIGGLSVIVGLVSLFLLVFGIFAFSPGWFVYEILFTVVNFLMWHRVEEIRTQVEQRQYAAAREKLLLWMILGWLFGIINGILLLLALLRLDQLAGRSGAPPPSAPGYVAAPPPGAAAPPPAGASVPGPTPPSGAADPAASVPPAGATAGAAGPACPRCGQPTSLVAQYGRYYCYHCAQYV